MTNLRQWRFLIAFLLCCILAPEANADLVVFNFSGTITKDMDIFTDWAGDPAVGTSPPDPTNPVLGETYSFTVSYESDAVLNPTSEFMASFTIGSTIYTGTDITGTFVATDGGGGMDDTFEFTTTPSATTFLGPRVYRQMNPGDDVDNSDETTATNVNGNGNFDMREIGFTFTSTMGDALTSSAAPSFWNASAWDVGEVDIISWGMPFSIKGFDITTSAQMFFVPEPATVISTIALLGIGGWGFRSGRNRRRNDLDAQRNPAV